MSKATPDKNLALASPELAKQWHSTRNGDARPTDFAPFSGKKVWWVCLSNPKHEWEAAINSRHKAGCPHCYRDRHQKLMEGPDGNRKPRPLSSFPDLMAEIAGSAEQKAALGTLPATSTRKIAWVCSRVPEHRWENQIRKRVVQGQGCPFCSNKKTGADNCLAARFRRISGEWDYERNNALDARFNPQTVNAGSHKSAWWRCVKGHFWYAQVKQRTQHGTECPKCNPQVSHTELRVLSELSKVLGLKASHGEEVDGLEADILFPGLKLIVEVDGFPWHAPERKEGKGSFERDSRKTTAFSTAGYLVFRLREKRLSAISGCTCVAYEEHRLQEACQRISAAIAKAVVLTDEQRQRIANYQLATDWADDTGFKAMLKALPGPLPGTSLAERFPDLVKQWMRDPNLPLTPENVLPSEKNRVWWQCPTDTSHPPWQAAVYSRTGAKKHGCPYCSGHKVTKDGSLLARFPKIAAQLHPNNKKTGDLIAPFTPVRYMWQCSFGHVWMASVANRTVRNTGCPVCTGKQASAERNLVTENPALAAMFDVDRNEKPAVNFLPNSGKTVWWRCINGHHWQAPVDTQARYGARCRNCNRERQLD